MAETIFERHKLAVDTLLAQRAADAIEKIPSIYTRLAEGDAEAVSQALTSCRRLIASFADAVFPPRDGEALIGEQPYAVGPEHQKNRIIVYIAERTTSASRRQRLRQTLTNLWDRTSAGVHDDVTPAEARSLFLGAYLFLGEVLELGDVPATPSPIGEAPALLGQPNAEAGVGTTDPAPVPADSAIGAKAQP